MPEPYVLKGTRTVPRRGGMSNHLFLFNLAEVYMMQLKEFLIIFVTENGAMFSKAILNRVLILLTMILSFVVFMDFHYTM